MANLASVSGIPGIGHHCNFQPTCQYDGRVSYHFSMNNVVDPALFVGRCTAEERQSSVDHLGSSHNDSKSEVNHWQWLGEVYQAWRWSIDVGNKDDYEGDGRCH